MADKNFGVKGLNLISDSGTPTISIASSIISYAGSLNLNAPTVAISTNISIGGQVVSNLVIPNNYSVGIGTTALTEKLNVNGNVNISGILTATSFVGSGVSLTGLIPNAIVGVNSSVYNYFLLSTQASGSISSISASVDYIIFNPAAKYLGIGTDNPTAGLDVNGTGRFAGTVTAPNFQGTATTANNVSSTININTSGIITSTGGFVGNLTGTATTATKLQNTRTFEITGDVVGAAVSFDGTGNVSIAATIQPNSVGLGTDTTGDYVQSISGVANQINVTGGTGEGSTLTVGFAANPTIPGNVTIANDLQVNNNLNVNGNITIGGTSAYILVDSFRVSDADIILGFTTNSSNQDASNDTTANHGGISIASTEGSPLINLNIAGIETLPPTYKKIMWFKAGAFAGLNTDAWLSNYAIGIGSTQFPSGTRLAAGNVQFTQNDLAVVRNINSSGIISASSFVGDGSGLSGITASSIVGVATYATSSGIATNLKGGAGGSIPYQSDVDTTVFLANGTSGYVLQANGGTSAPTWVPAAPSAAITGLTIRDEGSIVGTGSSISAINFVGSNIVATATGSGATITIADNLVGTGLSITGIVTATSFRGNGSQITDVSATYATNAGISTSVIGGISSVTQLQVTGISTFTNGPILVGTATSTGTAAQPLQVTGGAYVSGNVGIGTTNPTSKLHVVGNAYITGVTTSTDFDSLSDLNLKTNIQQIEDSLSKVIQIRGVTFKWKDTNRSSAGVIAQEVENVLPELVNGEETKTVNYNGMIGALVEAVKELKVENDILREKLEEVYKKVFG